MKKKNWDPVVPQWYQISRVFIWTCQSQALNLYFLWPFIFTFHLMTQFKRYSINSANIFILSGYFYFDLFFVSSLLLFKYYIKRRHILPVLQIYQLLIKIYKNTQSYFLYLKKIIFSKLTIQFYNFKINLHIKYFLQSKIKIESLLSR